MKAKDMAARYSVAGCSIECQIQLVKECVLECKALAEIRRVSTGPALAAVFKEVDQKWRAFAQQFPETVAPTGFKLGLHIIVPESKFMLPS